MLIFLLIVIAIDCLSGLRWFGVHFGYEVDDRIVSQSFGNELFIILFCSVEDL